MTTSLHLAGEIPILWLPQKRLHYTGMEIEKHLRSDQTLEGIERNDLPTPSLLLDLNSLEANIQKMARYAGEASIQLRPHVKTHKCPEIAKRQIQAGATGVCAATIHEAEVMASAGIRGLLITAEMVGRNKIERLLRMTQRQPDTMSVVDHIPHAQQLNQAAAAAEVILNVLIDIDPGDRRTGVEPGNQAVALAEQIMKLPNLKLRGIHSYSGSSSHVKGFQARRAHSKKAMERPLKTLSRLEKIGFPIEIMSGGSTGTYNIDSQLKGMTELQVGSYVLMDLDYRMIGSRDGPLYEDFAPSLSVLTTVISKNNTDRATVDAGLKAFATDRSFGPQIKEITGVKYQFGGDEHGILTLNDPSRNIRLGDRLEFFVPHCDPNVNLYDRIFCLRGTRVEAVWRIRARGHG